VRQRHREEDERGQKERRQEIEEPEGNDGAGERRPDPVARARVPREHCDPRQLACPARQDRVREEPD
jgi:hypothetical protein